MSKLLVDEISDADNTGPVTVTDGLTVQGAFTSLGIDDNATSTAMTIDSHQAMCLWVRLPIGYVNNRY
jgi:hypothetical protein